MHTLNEGFRADIDSLGLRFWVTVLQEGITASVYDLNKKGWIFQTHVDTFSDGKRLIEDWAKQARDSNQLTGNRLKGKPFTMAWNAATYFAHT
jgi:hypothetical protein